MTNKLFAKFFEILNKYWKTIIILVGLILIFSIFKLFTIPFNNNVELMLPQNEEFSKSLNFLRESNFSDKIILSLSLNTDDKTVDDLLDTAEQLKNSLKSPLIENVESGVEENNILEDIKEFLEYVPQIITEDELLEIDKEINVKNVKSKLKEGYNKMLSINSMFVSDFIQNDPLNIKTQYLQKLKALVDSIGYRVQFKNGHFVSMDEKHVMLILNTPVFVTDSTESRKLVTYIKQQILLLPNYIDVDIIGGHLHTLSNEDIIKKDITKTVIAMTLILLPLLIFVLKSFRAFLVFIVPVMAIVIAMNLTSYMIGTLSSFVVGLAAVIAGITVDYGIHIYLAMKAGGISKVKEITKPILVGVFTTMGVFASFFFSSINGYKQFAVLTNLSIIISIFLYLVLLPKLFYKKSEKLNIKKLNNKTKIRIKGDRAIALLWVVVIGVFIFFSKGLGFNNNIRDYDGSSDEIFSAEERFHKTWGTENEFAMFVSSGNELEKVLKINENANKLMEESFGEESFANIAGIYPSIETRRKNLFRWASYWKNHNEEKLKTLLQEQGAVFGYSKEAFKPFFETLYTSYVEEEEENNKDPKLIASLKQRFLQNTGSGYYAITYFADKKILVDKAREISEKVQNTFIISRNNMANSISVSVYKEVKKLAWIAGCLIVFLAITLLRNIRLTILALLPVITSIFMILGSFSLLGFSINAPAIIATLVVVGLCIDYGVFIVYDCMNDLGAGTLSAVTLSAVTTIAGGGVLLLATHPVLFYVGITMAIGIFSGYIVAAFVIPSCYRLWIVQ